MICSFFTNTEATVPIVEETTLADLADALRFGMTVDMPRSCKTEVMCVVPARFDPPKRLKDNITERFAFTGDVDGDTKTILTFDEMVAILRDLGLAFIVHSTTSSTVHQNRYRVIIPFDRPLTVEESEAASSSIHQMLGRVFDTKTFDAGRLCIFPQAWTGCPPKVHPDDWDEADAHHAFEADVNGLPMVFDDVIAMFPPEPKEEKVSKASQAEIQAFFDSMPARTDVDWHVLIDLDHSPIVNRVFVDDFLASQPGGRFFRFLNRVAGRALTKNLPVDVHTLVAIGKAMDARAGVTGRTGIIREAKRALAFAVSKHQTPAGSPAPAHKYSKKQIEAALKARKHSRVRY